MDEMKNKGDQRLGDKQNVLNGISWFFDNNLFILKLFDGFTQSHKMSFYHKIFWV